MTAINPEALSKYVGELYIAPAATPTAFVRLASVRNLIANYDNAANQVEIKADDTGTVFKGFTPEGRIEGEFLENIDRDTIALLLGGTSTDVAGTLVSGATQILANGSWNVNQFYEITNQNGDGSIISIISVVGSVDGALTVNTDYDLIKDPTTGKYGIVLQDLVPAPTLTTIAQNITITYAYTPNAAENIALTIAFQESALLVAKIEAVSGTKTRRITLSECTFEGVYGMSFLDVVEAGDLTGTTFTFKATSGSQFTLENEIL